MKKIYIQPTFALCPVSSEHPLAGSNEVEGLGINFFEPTMEDGSGDDSAVKALLQ